MSMLEFPTFEQMVATLSNPVAPVTALRPHDIELSTDTMIKEIFRSVKRMEQDREEDADPFVVQGSGTGSPFSYDASTLDYSGASEVVPYSGEL